MKLLLIIFFLAGCADEKLFFLVEKATSKKTKVVFCKDDFSKITVFKNHGNYKMVKYWFTNYYRYEYDPNFYRCEEWIIKK
jgi:hypothetical protein